MMQTVYEEKWNVRTHGAGILFALIAFPVLYFMKDFQGSLTKIIGFGIYFLSFILLYIASTSYHAATEDKRKILLRKLDHISIYFMISGTYVPYMLEYIPTQKAIIFLSIMYSLVIIGAVLKIWFTGKFERASVLLYVFLGWMIVFMGRTFYTNAPMIVILFVVLGGLAYMVGVYFYMNDQRKYYHAIWHVFVLLGSIFHFLGVYWM